MTTDVVDSRARSGTQSIRQSLGPATGNPVEQGYGSDVFLNISSLVPEPLTSGQYQLSYWQYVENAFDGIALAFLSEDMIDATTGGGFDEGALIAADRRAGGPSTTVFRSGTTDLTTLLLDQWVQYVVDIDLDNDSVDITYNGTTFHTGPWDLDGGGVEGLDGIDLWVSAGLEERVSTTTTSV